MTDDEKQSIIDHIRSLLRKPKGDQKVKMTDTVETVLIKKEDTKDETQETQ